MPGRGTSSALVLLVLLVHAMSCMSFDLESRRFRCDGTPQICDDGWSCGADGYCAQGSDSATDASVDASVDAPSGLPGEICGNHVDDDGDTLVDCADPECPADTTCGVGCGCVAGVPTENACMDSLDNDRDGQRDCLDADCPGQCVGMTLCCPDGACRAAC